MTRIEGKKTIALLEKAKPTNPGEIRDAVSL